MLKLIETKIEQLEHHWPHKIGIFYSLAYAFLLSISNLIVRFVSINSVQIS